MKAILTYLSELTEKLQDEICTIFSLIFFLLPRNVCWYPKLLVSREKMHFCQKHCYTLDVSDTSVFDFKGFLAFLFLFFLAWDVQQKKKSCYPSDMHFFAIALNCIDFFMMWCYCQYRLVMIQALKDGKSFINWLQYLYKCMNPLHISCFKLYHLQSL